jgi:hypothetical protein
MSKPRLVEITDPIEYEAIMRDPSRLEVPSISESGDGRVWADADELRAWRASQHTSAAKPHEKP